MSAEITVVFLLYNAEKTVGDLVRSIQAQTHPSGRPQQEWLRVLFMNDASQDATQSRLEEALAAAGNPPHMQIVTNPQNMGLAATLNRAFERVQTPYVLTCHCDAFFGRFDYVAEMVRLMDQTPDAAAITGLPRMPTGTLIPTAEKINLIANLMDIDPAAEPNALTPVGFAEGRCDAFRMSALASVGFYDPKLRTAGEDQVIAAKFRKKGFQVYQARSLPYELRVSDSQDSLLKLARHVQLFGRVHPMIVFSSSHTLRGMVGPEAGANRKKRTVLRLIQVASVPAYAVFLASGFLASIPFLAGIAALAAVALAKIVLFRRHLTMVRLSARELILLIGILPVFDLYYALGLAQGLYYLVKPAHAART